MSLIGEVLAILDEPMPPEPSEGCALCNYRKNLQELG